MSVRHREVDILTLGESLGLIVPDEVGQLAHAQPARIRFGGAESNMAIAAARLGASVTWISRLGTDGLGDTIERTLRGEGVTVLGTRDPSRPTGLMLKERPVPGRSRVRYYRAGSAASMLTPDDVPDDVIQSARLVHLTGITPALSGRARDTVRSVAERAQEAGALVSLDVNYRAALWSPEEARRELRALLPHVNILFAGVDEAALLDARISAPDDTRVLLDQFSLQQVVIKLGSAGAVTLADGVMTRVPAHAVDVVDSVGAGDAFVAGYVCAHLEGGSIEECLRQGAAVGAFACMVAGDWEGAPQREDLGLLDRSDPVDR